MKVSRLFIACLFAFFSCTSSHQSASPDTKIKIDELRTLINLSPDQAKKITTIENNYLSGSRKLASGGQDQESNIMKLKQKRTSAYKKVLSHEQFIKFQAIDNDLIKQAPVRFDKNI